MTATPIPRTLALAGYGDLDSRALRELPRGPPADRHARRRRRARARAGLRAHARGAARRAARRSSSARWSRSPRRCRRARGDGRVRAPARRRARGLQRRAAARPDAPAREAGGDGARSPPARRDVLVATTVIEVGIDVPNATVMLVENAERYGISQLHQLRGRVGRGEHASLCLLFGPHGVARGCGRWPSTRDGFALAEIDLELRGEGELDRHAPVGPGAASASRGCPRTPTLLERARARAEALLDARPRAAPRPSTRCSRDALRARCGAEALDDPGVRAHEGRSPGALGGRRLRAPRRARDTRPTSDRVREALFSMLGAARRRARARPVRGHRRARHRGALARRRAAPCSSSATRRACAALRANLDALGLGRERAQVRRRDALAALRSARATRRDIRSRLPRPPIPASARELGPRAVGGARRRCSRPAARVVVESDRRAPLELELPLDRRTPLRRHLDPNPRTDDPTRTASPSARAPTTRSPTATST